MMQDDWQVRKADRKKSREVYNLWQSGTNAVPLQLQFGRIGLLNRARYRLELFQTQVVAGVVNLFGEEREAGLSFNLLPIGMAIGIGLYFSAPTEPFLFALLLATMVCVLLAFRMQVHGKLFLFVCAIASVFAGITAAKLATGKSATPVLERQITTTVSGIVVEVAQNRRGSPRLLLHPIEIEGLEPDQMPRRVRLSAAKGAEHVNPGDTVSGLARLQPISGPAYPGGYDFGFHAWYEGLGGSGFFMGSPVVGKSPVTMTLRLRFQIAVNRVRSGTAERIRAAVPEATSGIAVALVTGDKSGINPESQDILRKTGLAHILAISGLHMALVTLTVIWVVRLGFSFLPNLALKFPIKKWAVCAGFVSATLYLFLSGAGIATQRAWVMISIMLLAVLLDRRAITMRSVVISALLILLISPQSLLAPGFQMSFAAVAALVAGYEAITKRKRLRADKGSIYDDRGVVLRSLGGIGRYALGLAITSLIAGTATGFIAAWHFNTIAVFGLLANLLAMPIVALVIMPMVMMSMLLMPFGYEALALVPVASGIDAVLYLAGEVHKISPHGITGQLPQLMLGLFALSLAALTLLKTRLRLISIAGFGLMALAWQSPVPPDVLISENGRAVGIIENGELRLPFPKRNRFVTEIWAKAWANGKAAASGLDSDQCNKERCVVVLSNSQVLHIVYNPDLIRSSCQRADLLIAPRLWWTRCRNRKPALVLNRQDFEKNGSHAIYLARQRKAGQQVTNTMVVKTGLPNSSRPWARNIGPIEDFLAAKANPDS